MFSMGEKDIGKRILLMATHVLVLTWGSQIFFKNIQSCIDKDFCQKIVKSDI